MKEKGTNKWENDDSGFLRALYRICKKITYLLTCLKKDYQYKSYKYLNKLTVNTSTKIILTMVSIKTMVLTFLEILCIYALSL